MPTWRQKLDQADPQHPSREAALVYAARTLTKLQMKRRKLNKELREVARQIRVVQKDMKKLMVDPLKETPWNEQMPSKLFGEVK